MKLLFILLISSISYSVTPRIDNDAIERTLLEDLNNNRLIERTHDAIENILKFSSIELKKRKKQRLANKILYEWENTYSLFLLSSRGLGDHKPLSEWLSRVHQDIENVIGIDLCEMFHIHDLYIINYAIPVVFFCVDNVDEIEYLRHYQPLLGVIGYWTAYISCAVISYGNILFFICSPLAEVMRFISYEVIAPRTNEFSWKLSCKRI